MESGDGWATVEVSEGVGERASEGYRSERRSEWLSMAC